MVAIATPTLNSLTFGPEDHSIVADITSGEAACLTHEILMQGVQAVSAPVVTASVYKYRKVVPGIPLTFKARIPKGVIPDGCNAIEVGVRTLTNTNGALTTSAISNLVRLNLSSGSKLT